MSGAARILITGGTGFFGKSLLAARKREWKEQKIIMQTIDSLIESFNEYR